MPAVMSGAESQPIIVLIDADEQQRRRYASALRARGHWVAAASGPALGRSLVMRLQPALVVADLETIAPDFEPLRPVLADLIGDDPASPVILLGSGAAREEHPAVLAEVDRELGADELVDVVEPILSKRGQK
jgi:DNA-binding NtrC family response regulator